MSDTTHSTNKLITFEISWKDCDPAPWFSIILEGKLTQAKRKKLFDLISSKFNAQELTYVDTGNLYTYNKLKHDHICQFLHCMENVSTALYYEDITYDFKDNDIADGDKGSYLFPKKYRIVATNLSNVDKI